MKRFYIDWMFVPVFMAFAGLSLAVIWSTNSGFLLPQLIFFLSGLVFFILISQFNISFFKHSANFFYVISIFLLLLTLFEGSIRGASRWLDLGFFQIQPSEVIKPFIIISFALALDRINPGNILGLLKNFIKFILPLGLIFLQPDLGNVIVYFLFMSAMIIAANVNLKILIGSVIAGLIASPLFWSLMHDYQKKRLLSFLNPELDPKGAGYNAIQSMIAVGSGRFFGKGLGKGTQSHLRFLPENHTDFIFASLTEELGLFGAFLLIILYIILFVRILVIAFKTEERFTYLVVIGIFIQLLSQVFINISMNMGILPITGITLPLVSSGGSSILATFIALGIISAIKKEETQKQLVIR
jgi:rod shape determining protein RodA